MGFGYLFIGYLFTFNFISYSAYTDIFAMLFMLLGLSSLARYASGFRYGLWAGVPLGLLSLVLFGEKIGSLLGFFPYSALFNSLTSVWSWILKAVFIWLVMEGVAQIAQQTELPNLRLKALRNRLLFLLPATLGVLLETNIFPTLNNALWVLTMLYMLSGLFCVFLNAKLFFECYIMICLEGDEDMPRAPSRFGFVNRLRAFSDRQDEKTVERKRQEAAQKAARKAARQGKKKK